jgi:hypothetical protein
LVDPYGLLVELICRPVKGAGGLADHCFVYVVCPEDGSAAVLSLFGDQSDTDITGYFPNSGYKYSYDPDQPPAGPGPPSDPDWGRDDPSSAGNSYNKVIEGPPGGCTCGFEGDVLDRFDAFPNKTPYDAFSEMNSNGFANYLLGDHVPEKGGPPNAPGFNKPHPGTHPHPPDPADQFIGP